MAKEEKRSAVTNEEALDIQKINQRLDMLDQRLDNIDSMVTSVAERVLKQLVTLNMTCPRCGSNIEIAIMGNHKPR